MKKSNTGKKFIWVIIPCCIIILIGIFFMNQKKNVSEIEEEGTIRVKNIETTDSKTFSVNGEKAQYKLLKNEDGTVYGIAFENPNLMSQITTMRRGVNENIKEFIAEDRNLQIYNRCCL